jgi:hypothetical protein
MAFPRIAIALWWGTKQAYTYPAEEEPLSLPFVLILSAAGPLFSKAAQLSSAT